MYSSYRVVGLKCIYVFRGKLILLYETEIYVKFYELELCIILSLGL